MPTPSLNDQVSPFVGMAPIWISESSEATVRKVQDLARPQHGCKIKSALGLRSEDAFPDIWLPVWTPEGMDLVRRLDAVDVPISRLFAAVKLQDQYAAHRSVGNS